jgi:putative PIN family toxin of toxin-antitoxin system
MRLVIDTDVLVAGLRSRTGASRILLLMVEAGVVLPLISVATVLEYEAVLTRTEQLRAMRLLHADIDAFLDAFIARSEEVSPFYNHGGEVRDPNDAMFVTAAINGNAEAIVTFNIRDYVPRDSRITGLGITVCPPGEILRRVSWRPSATSHFASLLR